MDEKRIEVVELPVKELKHSFGNPRKIKKKKAEELRDSLEKFGDFGVIVIDEHNNIISGTQRVTQMQKEMPETKVLCKRLHNYSNAELRAINIKANTHAGEWDLDLLSDWTADIGLDLGSDLNNIDLNERTIPEMELIRFEKYNYVIIATRTDVDFDLLLQKLKIEGKPMKVNKFRTFKQARAVWFDTISHLFK